VGHAQDQDETPEPAGVGADARVSKDHVYGEAGGVKLLLDVYQPKAGAFTGKRPGVLLVHGGGWVGGDKKFYEPLARALTTKGYDAFSVNYRLAPKFHYPAQLDDVQRATRWVKVHAEEYSLDPERLGALGDSAGAHLISFLASRDTRDNSDKALANVTSRVACVVDFYGPEDFTLAPTEGNVNAAGLQLLQMFFGKKPQEAPDLYKDGSPITFVTEKTAPFLIIHGTADGLVPPEQSQRLFDALQAAKVEARLALIYKQGHGFLRPSEPQTYGAMAEEFFARHLKP
jgi:acetyl esterase/lipase